MKKTYRFIAVTLLMAGALLTTACSNDDAAINNPEGQSAARSFLFTATLAPKGDDGGQTRNISVTDQGTADETLTTAWADGEQIAVYYEKNDGSHATAIATVGAPNSDGTASITATLEDAVDGTTVYFVYPASLHNGEGGIDDAKLGMNQHGTIADISTNFDGATGDATLVTDGTSFSTTVSTIKLENQLLIGKFIPKVGNTSISGIKRLRFLYGDRLYTVTPSGAETFGTDGIYLALMPVDKEDVTINVVTADKVYRLTKKVTLEKGKFYRNLGLSMTESSKTIKLSDLGAGKKILAEDGETLSGTNTSLRVFIAPGATVTLQGTYIGNSGSPGIECKGDATIILSGSQNTLTGDGKPGLQAGPAGTTLTIQGTGKLKATGNGGCSGIGSGSEGTCGNITISGGTVTATGGSWSAGIGGGYFGTCGNISIGDGTITAQCGQSSFSNAVIGSGDDGTCGDITITINNSITSITLKKFGNNQYFICGPDVHRGKVYIYGSECYNDVVLKNGTTSTPFRNCSLENEGKTWILKKP